MKTKANDVDVNVVPQFREHDAEFKAVQSFRSLYIRLRLQKRICFFRCCAFFFLLYADDPSSHFKGKNRSRSFRLFFFRRKMIFIKCPQRIFSLLFHQSFLAILLCLLTTFIFTRGEKSYWLRQLFQQSRNHKSTAKFPFFLFVIRENSRITKRKLKKFSYCANNNRVWFVSIITTTVHRHDMRDPRHKIRLCL
jgi:hypothetical protein